MRAAILAGGLGTRLAPYTTVLPKPLVPIGDRPILELILQQLAASGFTRVDLCVAHLGQLIQTYFDQSHAVPSELELVYHWEDRPLGTAGAVRELERQDGPLLVMNGDILTTLDYAELVRNHELSGAALSIATQRHDVAVALGVLECEGEEVVGFQEKPKLSYDASMGIYVYGPDAVRAIPPSRFDLPDLVLELLGRGQRVCRYDFEGPWYDIGTPEEFERATAAYLSEPDLFNP